MSEYQYYEFQALDRPLSDEQMRELRRVSTRATIAPTRFTNHYEWGDFKGDPAKWMERYFDAFLYVANWSTHELMLRLPHHVCDFKLVRNYCCGQSASVRAKGDFVILSFLSEDENGEEEWDDGSGWLSALTPLRADLIAGDYRMLYLAWLRCVQCGELDDDAREPPVPPGLGRLSASLRSFADFLRIDPDLIAAAAELSADDSDPVPRNGLKTWIAALPDAEKNDWLLRLASSEEHHVLAEFLNRFAAAQCASASRIQEPRTAAQLLEAAERRAQERQRQEAQKAAEERTRRQREEAARRDAELQALAERETQAWRDLPRIIARTTPKDYDNAIDLLKDLRELAERQSRHAEFSERIGVIKAEHARKPSFIQRLERAGLR